MEKWQALVEARDKPLDFDRKGFLAEFNHLLKTPGYTTDKSQLKERGLEEFKMSDKKTEEDILVEILKEEMGRINELLAATTETFMLSSPETLTVKRNTGAYSKKAHIGSEDFKPVRAYVGKRGKLIYVFKPVMAADYEEMEIDEVQAREKLMGFKDWCRDNLGELNDKIAEARATQAMDKERQALSDRAEAYKEIGFGSW